MDYNNFTITVKPDSAKNFKMSDEDYFGGGLPGHVSNSQLTLLNPEQGGSYEKFQGGFNTGLNSNSLELGSAVHALFLESEKYKLSTFNKPSGKVGPIVEDVFKCLNEEGTDIEDIYKACALKNDYYSNSLTPNRIKTLMTKGTPYLAHLVAKELEVKNDEIVLSEDMARKALIMVEKLKSDSTITNKFFPSKDAVFNVESYYEDVITLEVDVIDGDDIHPMLLKSKIDHWSIDFDNKIITVNDLKTTGKEIKYFAGIEFDDFVTGEKRFSPGSFQNFHYHRQVAMYSWMLWYYVSQTYKITFKDGWMINSNIGIVESIGEHNVSLLPINKKTVSAGYKEFQSLIKLLTKCKHYGT